MAYDWLTEENQRRQKSSDACIQILPIIVEQIYVSTIDQDFLNFKPIECRVEGQGYERNGDTYEFKKGWDVQQEAIFMLDEKGGVVTYDGWYPKPLSFLARLFKGKKRVMLPAKWRMVVFPKGVSCGEKMAYLGPDRIDSIRFAVSYLSHTKALIVYIPPGKQSIMQCLKVAA